MIRICPLFSDSFLSRALQKKCQKCKYDLLAIFARSYVHFCPDGVKFEKLFDGTLGVYPHRKVHIELLSDAVAKHVRPYAVPQVHLEAFRKKLLRLCKLNVLEPIGKSKWAHSLLDHQSERAK